MTEALDLLRAREHRRAELRGDSERIFEVRGRDSEWVRKSEIATAGPVRRGRGIPYLLAPYKRDQETYWVQAAHREPEFKLPGKATIKSENLIECYGALPAEAQNELDYLWFGTARLIDVLEDLAGGPVSLEHVEVRPTYTWLATMPLGKPDGGVNLSKNWTPLQRQRISILNLLI